MNQDQLLANLLLKVEFKVVDVVDCRKIVCILYGGLHVILRNTRSIVNVSQYRGRGGSMYE